MYAIIETGGKQYRVQQGDVIFIEKLDAQENAVVNFDVILKGGDGGQTVIGQPKVKNATVTGKILGHGKGQKIVIYKYKSKKNYRRKQGHRQPFTKVEITAVS